MLGSTNIVAFVPTKDAEKARAFYENVLGLRFVKDDGFALVFDGNGIMVRVAKSGDFKPAQFTILGWEIHGIDGYSSLRDPPWTPISQPAFTDRDSGHGPDVFAALREGIITLPPPVPWSRAGF